MAPMNMNPVFSKSQDPCVNVRDLQSYDDGDGGAEGAPRYEVPVSYKQTNDIAEDTYDSALEQHTHELPVTLGASAAVDVSEDFAGFGSNEEFA